MRGMSEREFQREVQAWCARYLSVRAVKARQPKLARCKLDRLVVHPGRLGTGWVPWAPTRNHSEWVWYDISREVDLTIGLSVTMRHVEGTSMPSPRVLPLVAIELKSGAGINMDEIDKKSAIYGPLVETYPWVHRVFLHEDMRRRTEFYLLRNARQFDTVLNRWDARSKGILARVIDHQLDYLLGYWGL
jgi:hypothetical protein